MNARFDNTSHLDALSNEEIVRLFVNNTDPTIRFLIGRLNESDQARQDAELELDAETLAWVEQYEHDGDVS